MCRHNSTCWDCYDKGREDGRAEGAEAAEVANGHIIEKLGAENERLKETLALERRAYIELEIRCHNAEHSLAICDSENEKLKNSLKD